MGFDLNTTKMYLRLTDRDDDLLLERFGVEADEAVENFLIGVAGSTNVGSVKITDQINDLANYMVLKKYYLAAQNFDGAAKWGVEIEKIKESIVRRLTSINSGSATVVEVPHW